MIDTLYTLRTIPIATTIQDSIITNTSIRGGIDIGIQDSLNFVLSGSPSVLLDMPNQIDWISLTLGVLSILSTAAIAVYTVYNNKELQKSETEELRRRKIQEIAVTRQAEMFRQLQKLTDMVQESVDETNIMKPTAQKKFRQLFNSARNFLNQNTIYIRDPLWSIASNVLDLYEDPNFIYDTETIREIGNKIDDYCNEYNK
ncbi:MAG: hypothetical protein J6S09_06105 [Paludibacteraceae bacterium]|nr:hypothetical protein [Paludibacteraceae bacterium]